MLAPVDESLQRAGRTGAFWERAAALRRAGRAAESWALLDDRCRRGDAGEEARTLLDEWFPLDAQTASLVEVALEPGAPAWTHYLRRRAAVILLGAADPRVAPRLLEFAARFADAEEGAPAEPAYSPRRQAQTSSLWRSVPELLELPRVERVVRLARQYGAEALALVRLPPAEALEVFDRLAHQGGPLLASAVWLLGQWGEGPEAAQRARRVEAAGEATREARRALRKLGREVEEDPLPSGLPVRPPWDPDLCPAIGRDELTACHTRWVLHDPAGPRARTGGAGAGLPVGRLRWGRLPLIYLDLDSLVLINDRYGWAAADRALAHTAAALHDVAGDRVVRWAGDEFLVPYEGDDPARAAEALRSAIERRRVPVDPGAAATLSVTATAVVLRDPPLEVDDALGIVEEGMAAAKRGGTNRVVVLDRPA